MKNKDFMLCIDSDGTVFNSQEIKFKKYIIPGIIHIFQLESISKFVIETAEFVNLYSEWRGIRRYEALLKVFELLRVRVDVENAEILVPYPEPLKNWIAAEENCCNATLQNAVTSMGDPLLRKVLQWDEYIDGKIKEEMHDIDYFEFVPESLEKASKFADIFVVSSESEEILRREWKKSGLIKYVRMIAGRETGNKKTIIRNMIKSGYAESHSMMLGDALGDLEAAKSNHILFYPINPSGEISSWKRFFNVSFDAFISESFSHIHENANISEFRRILTSTPPWIKSGK